MELVHKRAHITSTLNTDEQVADFVYYLSEELRKAERQGKDEDKPEGNRFVIFSDTLVSALSDRLADIHDVVCPHCSQGA